MANTIKLKDDTGAVKTYEGISVIQVPTNDAQTTIAEYREGVAQSYEVTSKSGGTVTPSQPGTYMSSVTVTLKNAENITKDSIRAGRTILDVTGEYTGGGNVVIESKTATFREASAHARYEASGAVDGYSPIDITVDVPVGDYDKRTETITTNGEKTLYFNDTESGYRKYAKSVKFNVAVPTGGEIPVAARPTYYTVGPQATITPEAGTVFSSITATVDVPVIDNYAYQQTITENGHLEIPIPDTTITGVGDVPQYAHKISLDVNVSTGGPHAPYTVTQPYESNGTFTVNAPTDGQGKPIYMDSVTFTINVPTGGKWPTPTVRVAGSVASTDPVAGVTKYMLYVNGSKRGYLDQNGTWHPINT